jgi:ankyrin repeat protein
MPLHWYVTRDDVAAMRTILQHGAKLRSQWKMLHKAGSLEAAQVLVEYGADVTRRADVFNTPLQEAAEAGKTEVVEFLVERWPEGMRAKDRLWNTPLHLAAGAGQIEVVRFLLEGWPEGKEVFNKRGYTPLRKFEKLAFWVNLHRRVKKEMMELLGGGLQRKLL